MIWMRLKEAWLVLCYGHDARIQRVQLAAFEQGKQYGQRDADLQYRSLLMELDRKTSQLDESNRKLDEMTALINPVLNLLNAFRKE